MEIKTTYVFKRDDGVIGYACGIMPTGVEILEERQILIPAEGYDLKRISDGEVLNSVWLQGDDVKENYEEVEEEQDELPYPKH